MEYAAIAAAVVGLITALISAGKDAEAQALKESVVAQYGPEIIPHLERAQAEQVPGSTLAGMPEDDSLRRRQLDALSELENVYRNEGTTPADVAAMQLASDNVISQANARASQYGQAAIQRGMVNSGLAAALQSQGQQDATNALAGASRQNAVDARSRALRALESGAGLAGSIRGQDFQRAQSIAEAQDRINAFQAQLNTDANNYNLSLPQQNFENLMQVLNARANAVNGVAAGLEGQADDIRAGGAGASNAALTYGMWGDSKKKGDK